MEGSKKRMALAEAIEYQQKNSTKAICVYCDSEMNIQAAPSIFFDMVVVDLPQHVCRQCNESSSSLAIEEFKTRRDFADD